MLKSILSFILIWNRVQLIVICAYFMRLQIVTVRCWFYYECIFVSIRHERCMPEVHASVGRSADARVYVNVVNNNAVVTKYDSISI